LRGTYSRHFEPSSGEYLGLSWHGAYQFALRSKAQVVAISKALLTSCLGKHVKVQFQVGKTKAAVEIHNMDLAEVQKFVEDTFAAIASLPGKATTKSRKKSRS
jgi:hypothetical protein